MLRDECRSDQAKKTDAGKMLGGKSRECVILETKTERDQWSLVSNGAEKVE